jgi:hypothetical protein
MSNPALMAVVAGANASTKHRLAGSRPRDPTALDPAVVQVIRALARNQARRDHEAAEQA